MKDVDIFLASPAITPSIRGVKDALNTHFYTPEIHNSDQYNAPDKYAPPFEIASVLLALWNSPENGIQVLLTQRADHLRNHPGQISFPGGKMDQCDDNIIQTALRETEEEVGLKAVNLNILGQLGDYFTTSGFCVSPVVAEVTKLTPMMICYDEVESAHWVPLNYLLDPKNFEFKQKVIENTHRTFFEIRYQDLHIWGVTAGIFYGLYKTLTTTP